ncbi:fatty acid desaturase family protein [Sphingobium sp. B2D3C]|uniref:fatty acid desaturase family protein n=1 Tax=unclassified Sphingobium TaxID=2611147 RepID=UPI0039B496C4|nr:fatty acid desaturase [Sphingobium sp. B2D3B]MCW2399730.1 fatty acid desaturase [Sphingobium sp. B2D3C]
MTAIDQRLDAAPSAPAGKAPAAAGPALATTPDDMAMLRAAVDLTRDLATARPGIYWPDFLASALIGYAAMGLAMLASQGWIVALAGVISALALYRATSFIHELTHIRAGALPGFRFTWNLLIGIPLLFPSFLYEGVHTQHHAKTRYGTIDDPEYLPLALMKPWSLPLFILVAALAPVAFIVRFGVLAPLSLVIPPLRRFIVERYSALSINPDYRRRAPEGDFARMWAWQEAGTSLWSMALIASVPLLGWRPLLTYLAILSVAMVANQLRTLVAHLWENEGETMTVTGQFLDSVNVPPPAPLAALWAPVGLRYHALHHLLPSMPYHALGEAHRRIAQHLGAGSTYDRANYPGMVPLVVRIARSTMVAR